MSYRVLKLAGVGLRAIHTTVFLMSDLRFDWHPSLSSPLIDERLELLVQEALKDYKSGSGIQPKATYEASYRAIGKHLISALYCAYHAKERVSLPFIRWLTEEPQKSTRDTPEKVTSKGFMNHEKYHSSVTVGVFDWGESKGD